MRAGRCCSGPAGGQDSWARSAECTFIFRASRTNIYAWNATCRSVSPRDMYASITLSRGAGQNARTAAASSSGLLSRSHYAKARHRAPSSGRPRFASRMAGRSGIREQVAAVAAGPDARPRPPRWRFW